MEDKCKDCIWYSPRPRGETKGKGGKEMKEPSELTMGETFFFILLAYALGVIIGIVAYIQCSIRPIDVYRGKTTLEITYRDSVAVDSVVVYKMK